MTPRAVRPALARNCATGLSEARLASLTTPVMESECIPVSTSTARAETSCRARSLTFVRLCAMRPAEGSEPVARRLTARPGGGGVVSRTGLWERLGGSARGTMVSAPPGSGKTVLLRSWIGQAALAERAAWVPVGRDEGDPTRLWLA